MIKIEFMNQYLKSKILKKVNISMIGIINFNIDILKFGFKIMENKLKIKNDKLELLEIVFDEVKNVEKDEEGNIIINFNINETIIIKENV